MGNTRWRTGGGCLPEVSSSLGSAKFPEITGRLNSALIGAPYPYTPFLLNADNMLKFIDMLPMGKSTPHNLEIGG